MIRLTKTKKPAIRAQIEHWGLFSYNWVLRDRAGNELASGPEYNRKRDVKRGFQRFCTATGINVGNLVDMGT